MSFVVFWIEELPLGSPIAQHQNCGDSVTHALKVAEDMRKLSHVHHVCIAPSDINRVGGDGVDAVQDGVLPDGSVYTWKKRRQ